MIASQEQESMPKGLWLSRWQRWVPTEALLLLLFLLLTATILFISSNHARLPQATTLALADLAQNRQPLELKGSLLADSQQGQLTALHFVLALAPAASPLDLTAPHLTLRYQDDAQQLDKLPWAWRFQSGANDNSLLEAGERVELTVPLITALTPALGANTTFRLELAAPQRLLFSVQRTTPPLLDTLLDLN